MGDNLRLVRISAQAMAEHLTEGNAFKVVDGVPEDAELEEAGYEPERRMFYVMVEHESFDEVEEAEFIPEFRPILEDVRPEVFDDW